MVEPKEEVKENVLEKNLMTKQDAIKDQYNKIQNMYPELYDYIYYLEQTNIKLRNTVDILR